MSAALPPVFAWEGQQPLGGTSGFTATAGVFKVTLGYLVYESAVLLFAMDQVADTQSRVWRHVWAPYAEAVNAAEDLCADVEEYLDSTRAPWRPSENFDMDDFLHHLHLRITNGFH